MQISFKANEREILEGKYNIKKAWRAFLLNNGNTIKYLECLSGEQMIAETLSICEFNEPDPNILGIKPPYIQRCIVVKGLRTQTPLCYGIAYWNADDHQNIFCVKMTSPEPTLNLSTDPRSLVRQKLEVYKEIKSVFVCCCSEYKELLKSNTGLLVGRNYTVSHEGQVRIYFTEVFASDNRVFVDEIGNLFE